MAKKKDNTRLAPNLYALLVGINQYRNHPLQGCLNDVDQMKQYLTAPFVQTHFGEVCQRELRNGEATKEHIVRAFREHLGQARKNDTVLFYFSGHGARERTRYAIFQEDELDGNIGGILCATFEGADQPDLYRHVLSNKELRYLIRSLAMDESNAKKAHVVAIFDCCNSGSNTRSVLGAKLPANARQVSRNALPGRELNHFIFREDPALLSRLEKGEQSLEELMPQGDHIMLAACREVELAWETEIADDKQSGAFTTALIDVLRQHKGQISYFELYGRVLNRMKFSLSSSKGDRGQTPQVYVRTRNLNDRYHLFLTNLPNEQPAYGLVEYSDRDREWRIDLGAFHGIPVDQQATPTQVKVYPLKRKKDSVAATIKKVYPFYAVLDFSAGTAPPTNRSCRGELEGMGIAPVAICMSGEKEAKAAIQKALKTKMKEAGPLFALVRKEMDADYVVRIIKGAFTITRPHEPSRPVVEPIRYQDKNEPFDATKVAGLYTVLQHIGRWTFLRNLAYTGTELPVALMGKTTMYPVEFRLFRLHEKEGTEKRILPRDNKFVLEPELHGGPTWVRIELVNHAPQLLNVSLATMTGDFGFIVQRKYNVMKGPVLLLREAENARHEHIAKSRGKIPDGATVTEEYFRLSMNQYYVDYNLPGEPNYFKLIVSTKPLETIETFHMKRLGYPKRNRGDLTAGWEDAYQLEEPELPVVEWDVRTIEIYLTNPAYDPDRS